MLYKVTVNSILAHTQPLLLWLGSCELLVTFSQINQYMI